MTTKFLLDNIYMIAVALVSGGMLLWPMLRQGGGAAGVTTLQATMMINQQDALVLDTRDKAEFEKGHILNSRNVPASELEQRLREIERWKSKPVIVHDGNGTRSAAALAILKKHGFNNVFQLNGGFAAWLQAGLPTTK